MPRIPPFDAEAFLNSQDFRTFLRTNPLTGSLVTWGFRHYVAAICESAPDDCSSIPKVADAGRIIEAGPGPSGENASCQVMHNGVLVKKDSYYGSLNTDLISRFRGHHEPQEEKVYFEVLKSLPDKICVVEAGSYWGYYSMWARKEKREVRNILVEPVDRHMEVGKTNFALNRMDGEFIRAYVGERSKPPHARKLEGVNVRELERISIDD